MRVLVVSALVECPSHEGTADAEERRIDEVVKAQTFVAERHGIAKGVEFDYCQTWQLTEAVAEFCPDAILLMQEDVDRQVEALTRAHVEAQNRVQADRNAKRVKIWAVDVVIDSSPRPYHKWGCSCAEISARQTTPGYPA